MALATGLASNLATRKTLSPRATQGLPGATGGTPITAPTVRASQTVGGNTPSPAATAPSFGDPYAEAASRAAGSENSFNLAAALTSIAGAPDQAGLKQQSDYYGMLAGLLGQDPTSGYAHAQSGLQQALLGLNQQQLGYDANTLHAQDKYAQGLYGQAGQSYNSTIAYLNALAGANQTEYNQHIGNFGTISQATSQAIAAQLAGANLASQQQQANYTSDSIARGAVGAHGTHATLANMVQQLRQQIGDINATGKQSLARIGNEKSSFVTSYKNTLAQIARQRTQNKSDYTKAGMDTLERVQEINNALAKNALEVKADDVRKQQAATSANQQSAQSAYQSAFGALQYQQQQAAINAQMNSNQTAQFYNALQLAPQINANGGRTSDFLAQQRFSPEMMQSLSYPQIQQIAGSLNKSGITSGEYARFGFTPDQLKFFGLTPTNPFTSVSGGGGRRIS